MPALNNARHERYCQLVVDGKGSEEAYRLAGYRHNSGNASRLRNSEPVIARIAEILEERAAITAQGVAAAVKAVKLSKQAIIEMLLEDRAAARAAGQTGAAIRAAELLGKELGMFIDRSDITVRTIDEMTDDEVRRLVEDARQAQLAQRGERLN